MALDVKVKIELSKASGSIGFGIPLLLETGATKAVSYVECLSLDDVVTAGFAETTDMYKAANMLLMQNNRPTKIAICASAETEVATAIASVVSKDWRQLVLVNGETDDYVSAADYIETTKGKFLFVSMAKADFETFKTSVASKEYNRTVIFVNSTPFANAALVGEMAGRTVGSYTYKNKTLKGVVAENLTDTEIEALHDVGAFGYVTKAGDNVTTEGFAQSGVYIDETENMDYVIHNIEYRTQKVFNNTAKVPYDNTGIALLEAATETALKEAANNGIIAVLEDGSYDYSVSFGGRDVTTEADRASRIYNYGTFRFSLAGAVHYADITGTVTK